MKLYRYTSNGEGIWSIGKRLLPESLVDEANENRKWMKKPNLPEGNYRFYLTNEGRSKYEQTLLNTHKKYLSDIKIEEVDLETLNPKVVYKDEYQVVTNA